MDADKNSKSVESFSCENITAVNGLILEYYKKFGRKRDLEQYFSLSTAQCEIQDPTSSFWRKMKESTDSDSGEKKSESSTELCRISIKCSIPEPASSKYQNTNEQETPTISPPIINENEMGHSDNESDEIHSQISLDGTLDRSTNKAHSPTSSVTSQRKLEWDSLGDVGYANQSDKKTSASSLSTLERLALQQQHNCISDSQKNDLGLPTAHSTPLEPNESKTSGKKKIFKKTTKITQKEVDCVQLSIPQVSDIPINLNLTKHISFNMDKSGDVNVEKSGDINVENIRKNESEAPKKLSVETGMTQEIKVDKEIQTSLINQEESIDNNGPPHNIQKNDQKFPVLISLNTLRRRNMRNVRRIKRKPKNKKPSKAEKENIPHDHKGEQISEAESFEYMPGHVYHLNQINNRAPQIRKDNKSSLESSTGNTTESSKEKNSFTKDLEKSINLLKVALRKRHADDDLKKRLIKEIVQRLISSKYNDDDDSTDFLSGLSFDSKKLGLGENHTTTSTSDPNETTDKRLPKKSILRQDKFDSNIIPSTSQSVPNLASVKAETHMNTHLFKPSGSHTDSDISIKERTHSYPKTSSEELYQKYTDALKRELAYKKHLREKELFLKQKLVGSDTKINVINQYDIQSQNRIKNLMKDLIRNNYDDGSGDASRLEGGPQTNLNVYVPIRNQRSHSVFTLSSGSSDNRSKNVKLKSKSHNDSKEKPSCSKTERHCLCPYYSSHGKIGVTDSSVQVNMQCCDKRLICNKNEIIDQYEKPKPSPRCISDIKDKNTAGHCKCMHKILEINNEGSKLLITNCNTSNSCAVKSSCDKEFSLIKIQPSCGLKQRSSAKVLHGENIEFKESCSSKSSQTNINLEIPSSKKCWEQDKPPINKQKVDIELPNSNKAPKCVHEGIRWTQTEISIDPKISDPALSDITAVSDSCCAKLVGEQYKEISNKSLPCGSNTCTTGSSTCHSKNSTETNIKEMSNMKETSNMKKSCNVKMTHNIKETCCIDQTSQYNINLVTQRSDKEVQSTENNCHTVGSQVDIPSSNNFTIPIQGTNMTLKVSLGSKEFQDDIEKKSLMNNCLDVKEPTYETRETSTCKPNTADNGTSITEECSKATQCTDTNIFDQYYNQTSNTTLTNSNNRISQKNNKAASVLPHNQRSGQRHPDENYCDISPPELKSPPVSFSNQLSSQELNFIKRSCYDKNMPQNAQNVPIDLPNNQFCNQNEKNIGGSCSTHIASSAKINGDCCKFNTYPKLESRKPLLRSNTDTDRIEKGSHVTFNKLIDNLTKGNHSTKDGQDGKFEDMNCKSDKSGISCSEVHESKQSTDCDTTHSKSSKSTNNSSMGREDPLIKIIQDLKRRYSKKDIDKNKRNRCYKDIIAVINYLLDTEESSDDQRTSSNHEEACTTKCGSKVKEKSIQSQNKSKAQHKNSDPETSDLISSDLPSASTDSTAYKVINKIMKECQKYHHNKCKSHSHRKCEVSSSTSTNCDKCKHVHCHCKSKCKNVKSKCYEKNSVAYNLIIQTSDSVVSEDNNMCMDKKRQLKNIVVKVPSRCKNSNMPFKEMSCKIEKNMCGGLRACRCHRSKSLPCHDSDISSTDEILRKAQACSVREYLERNRPDFIEKSSNRQSCLKILNETRHPTCPRMKMIVVHSPECSANCCMGTASMYCSGVPFNQPCVDPYNNLHCIQRNPNKMGQTPGQPNVNCCHCTWKTNKQ
ncbi:unnamed protein product [Leptidea sinapis]|uniref:Uncharacterized protein n=1 Tax=Leptidea sinapis TaxID=189913 RepID=A0A5E4QUC8_9NEOP|nr:unnamed protein product [Leptidea sinapis]